MPNELSRRSVLKTTAWSVPVIALAVAAPAASASGITAIITSACLVDQTELSFSLSATADFIPPNALQVTYTSSTLDLTSVTFSPNLTPVSVTVSSATFTYGFGVITIPTSISITGVFPNGAFNVTCTAVGFGGDSATISVDHSNDFCLAS